MAVNLPSNSGWSRFNRAHSSLAASALRKEPSCTRTDPPALAAVAGAPKMAGAPFTGFASFAVGPDFGAALLGAAALFRSGDADVVPGVVPGAAPGAAAESGA